MSYGFIIPAAGQNLLAGLLSGEQLRLSRVMVGSGRLPDDADPSNLTDLIEPVAQATSTEPVVADNMVSMIIEYRNYYDAENNLGAGFHLNEFGIYALDKNWNEVLLYYGALGDNPQSVPAYSDGQLTVIRYPVTIGISTDLQVITEYAPDAWLTAADAEELIARHNSDPLAHGALINEANVLLGNHEGRIKRLEDAVFNEILGNPFLVVFDTLDGLVADGVWNTTLQRIEF